MSPTLIFFLAIGTVLMGIPIAFAAKRYQLSVVKALIATILLTVTGTLGTKLLYFLENGDFSGLSFYGAVFLVPIVFLLAARILRMPYGKLMDLCAIGECIMLALMKVACLTGECCMGMVLFTTATGEAVRFPSREVELLVALVLFAILLSWALKKKQEQKLYAWYLLLYGSTRFVLNLCRDVWHDLVLPLPIGNIWSLVAMIAGAVWLAWICKKGKTATDGHE